MRKCKECGKIKSIEEFYPSQKSYCKKCHKERTINWQKNNPERLKIHQRNIRAKSSYRKKQAKFYRKWYAKHGRKRAKNYQEASSLWRKLNPQFAQISHIVQYAIKTGKIKKPNMCEACKEKRKLIAHHDNYEFPLKVRWLCYSCHKNLHNSKDFT